MPQDHKRLRPSKKKNLVVFTLATEATTPAQITTETDPLLKIVCEQSLAPPAATLLFDFTNFKFF